MLLHEAPPAPSGEAEPVEFRVEAGEGFGRVARRLETAGLAVSERRLRILARLTHSDREIRAGTYLFTPGTAPDRILDDLVEGNVLLRKVTVREGWRLDQIAEEVEQALGIPAQELLEAAADPRRREALGCTAPNLEGYLFPDTYLLPDDATAGDVVDAMTRRLEEVWATLRGAPDELLDRHAVLTLASIVEAETALPEEKPRIAAVYLNRLRKNWKLQADPTVRYGLERFRGRLYYKHLAIDTPYNSYLHAGLPPGPIGAPGRESLQAVLEPLTPCEDFYFVASGEGGHIFSRTREEHVRAKEMARSGGSAAEGGVAEAGAAEASTAEVGAASPGS